MAKIFATVDESSTARVYPIHGRPPTTKRVGVPFFRCPILRKAELVGQYPPRFFDPQTQNPNEFVRRRSSRKTGILRGGPIYPKKGRPALLPIVRRYEKARPFGDDLRTFSHPQRQGPIEFVGNVSL
jgi:hypothetical protein